MTVEEPVLFDVFVYGTLKRGQRNYERFCQGALAVREATVRGQLYDLPYGFPALVVPEDAVVATGTKDYPSDAEAQNHEQAGAQEVSSLWNLVHGELFTFDDPEKRLPDLDALEGFRPDEKGFYRRVLVPTTLAETGTVIFAWTYAIESASGVYLPGGRWPAP